MAKYKVLKAFSDLTDNDYIYNTGDTYPRGGHSPSASRIKELSSDKNKQGVPLIEALELPVKKTSRGRKKSSER